MQKKGVMFPLLDGILQVISEVDSNRASLDDLLDDSGFIPVEMRRTAAHWLFSFYRYRIGIERYVREFANRGKIKKSFFDLAAATVCHCAFQNSIAREKSVNAFVEYAKIKFGMGEGRFLNALLRKVCRENPQFKAELPEWCRKKWNNAYYGKDFITAAEKCLAVEPAAVFRRRGREVEFDFNVKNADNDFLKKLSFFETDEMDKCLNSPFFEQGLIYVQDTATGGAVELLDRYIDKEEGDFIDVCGAPGGKAIMFADLHPSWHIAIGDRSAKRQERTAENLRRCKVDAEIICMDASKDKSTKQYDVVFADVPCSNSGVWRRRPDVLYRLNSENLAEVVKIQQTILENIADYVKVGGLLLYSTCSVEREENCMQIADFLKNHPEFEFLEDCLLLPSASHDGAFSVCMRRKK